MVLTKKMYLLVLTNYMYVLVLTKYIYVLVLTNYIFAQNQPGLGPGDDQDGEDMAGCP